MTLAELAARLPSAGSPWRARGLAVLAVLVALAVGYSAGRFSGPAKVETRDVERVIYKDKIVEVVKTVTVQQAAKTTILWRDRVIDSKTGITTERVVEKFEADTKVSITSNAERTATLSGDKTSDKATITTSLPRWRVGVGVGGSLVRPLLPLGAFPFVIQIEGEFRIVGGLSAGIWINTVGAAGVVVSLQF